MLHGVRTIRKVVLAYLVRSFPGLTQYVMELTRFREQVVAFDLGPCRGLAFTSHRRLVSRAECLRLAAVALIVRRRFRTVSRQEDYRVVGR